MAAAARKAYAERLATARFASEEGMLAAADEDDDGPLDAAMGAMARPAGRRAAGGVAGGLAGGGVGGGGAGRGARAAVECAVLQAELGVCEGRCHEAEQHASLVQARHEAVVEPLVAQREQEMAQRAQEVSWWRSELETERLSLMKAADDRCEALQSEWSTRYDQLTAE